MLLIFPYYKSGLKISKSIALKVKVSRRCSPLQLLYDLAVPGDSSYRNNILRFPKKSLPNKTFKKSEPLKNRMKNKKLVFVHLFRPSIVTNHLGGRYFKFTDIEAENGSKKRNNCQVVFISWLDELDFVTS